MSNVEVYKGRYYLKWVKKPLEKVKYKMPEKVVVLDLDETLGSFGDLYLLWSGVKHINKSFHQFDKLMDLYPEILRYGIMIILEYLYEKKKSKECSKILIYTNNRCSKEWVTQICKYFQNKIHSRQPKGDILIPLFNKLICAFRINNKVVEKCRTTYRKTYQDLIRCANLSPETEICFIDDQDHHDMKNSRVYYICPKPYHHSLNGTEMITRFVESKWFVKRKSPLLYSRQFWVNWFRSHGRHMGYERRTKNVNEDIDVTKKMMLHIKKFLSWRNPHLYRENDKIKTRKQKKKRLNRTRRGILQIVTPPQTVNVL